MFSLFLAEVHPESGTIHIIESVFERLYEANVFNLVIVLLFLYWIGKKLNVLSGLDNKLNSIKQRISGAEENRSKTENELETTRKNVEGVGKVVDKIKIDAAEIAESLSKSIISEAQVEAESLEKNSERIIEGEKETAAILLTNNLTKAAFDIAEEHVKQAIDNRLHEKYIDEFIEGLDKIKV
jgi:F-type H+-transporting ATPase subunit b